MGSKIRTRNFLLFTPGITVWNEQASFPLHAFLMNKDDMEFLH